MEPTINTGSLVFFDKGIDKDALKVGDIIIFNYAEYGDVPITHRIINIENIDGVIHYICKGDAVTDSVTQNIISTDVIGLVTGSSLFLGNLITFIQKPVVMIVGSLILIIFAVSLFFEPDKDEEDKKTDQDEEIERLQKRLDELSNKK